jgi:hypothetical protein
MHVLDGKVTTPDSRLIRDDEQFETRILQTLECCGDTGINDNLFRTMEVILFLDERAVPIQKHRAIHGGGASGKQMIRQRQMDNGVWTLNRGLWTLNPVMA